MKPLRPLLIPILTSLLIVTLFVLNQKLDHQAAQLGRLLATRATIGDVRIEPETTAANDLVGSAEWHTVADVEKRFAAVATSDSAPALAVAIAEVDEWLIEPKSSAAVQSLLDRRLIDLRKRVLDDVKKTHLLALAAKSGAEATKAYSDAGALVALFPMSGTPSIVEQARGLTTAHRNVGMKLEVAKRVRYNRWTVERLEKAIQDYHAKSSFWSPKKENTALIDSLVTNLGEVDPNQLEPSVLSLYNYAVEMTKDSISEADKVSLAKRLTAPEIRRMLPDDF